MKMTLEVISVVLSCLALCVAAFALWRAWHKSEQKSENELCTRFRSLLADMIMLMTGCLLVSVVVFVCVHMFRLWNTGRLLVTAVSKCSAFLSAAVWPLMILLLVIIYRKHVVNALEKIPKFIENYHASDKVTAAEASDDEEDSEMEHTTSTMSLIEKGARGTVDTSKKHLHAIEHATVGAAFENYVLTKLQREIRAPISREVNLFSNKFVRFDGAVVRGERITGIEVCYNLNMSGRNLQRCERFYRSLSEKDQKHFDLLFCVRGDNATYSRLENLRDRLSFPVEFRCFPYEPVGRGDIEKCTSVES